MENIDFNSKVKRILEYDTRYPVEAYEFINAAVKHTISEIAGKDRQPEERQRHINAGELLEGMIRFALEQFGPLAWEVLSNWRLTAPEDVGNMVFNLVGEKLFAASAEDSRDDFDAVVLDLREALLSPFRCELNHSPPAAPIIA